MELQVTERKHRKVRPIDDYFKAGSEEIFYDDALRSLIDFRESSKIYK